MVECKEVIVTDIETRGRGVERDPVRRVIQVFEKDGTFIAENDKDPLRFVVMDMVHFAKWSKDKPKIDENSVYEWLKTIDR